MHALLELYGMFEKDPATTSRAAADVKFWTYLKGGTKRWDTLFL